MTATDVRAEILTTMKELVTQIREGAAPDNAAHDVNALAMAWSQLREYDGVDNRTASASA